MEDAINIWKAIIAAVGTAATYLWGGWDAVFAALVVLACMDYVTGWAAAWVHGRLSSDVGRRGIAKKAGMFAIVVRQELEWAGHLRARMTGRRVT